MIPKSTQTAVKNRDNPGLLQDEKFKAKWDAIKLEIANAQKGNQ